MLRLETLAERTARTATTRGLEVLTGSDTPVLYGHQLERAQAEDLAWRRARSQPVQNRLERAFGTQAFGQWVAFTGFWAIALGSWSIALVCCLISLCGFELEPVLARAFVSPVLLPGLSLVVTVFAGLCLASVGRCHRQQLLRWARRHSIDVEDPGDPALPELQG